MDNIIGGLLSANVVEIQYYKFGNFLTRGLFTLHPKFIEGAFDFNKINSEAFFSAYEILRKKVIDLENQDQIISTDVFNPRNVQPLEMYSPGFQATVKEAKAAIKAFKEVKVQKICSRGDPFKLSLKSKATLIDLFMATGNSLTKEKDIQSHLEDIAFADPIFRQMSQMRYGFFFAMDYEWKSDEEALKFAAKKWLSLIDVYKELYLQDASEELKENISKIKYPNPNEFKTYESIVDYWPYFLTPRPEELLDSDAIAEYEIQESNESTKSEAEA